MRLKNPMLYVNDYKKLVNIYIVAYFLVITFVILKYGTAQYGEWDDYSLPMASLLNGHISIQDVDIVRYKEMFAEWSKDIDGYSLSKLYARDGGELAWYFPLYAFLCFPMYFVLKFLGYNTTMTFCLTNILALYVSITYLLIRLNSHIKNKILLILLLTINPIVFILPWCLAETVIYSIIILGLVEWYNKNYNLSAFFISLSAILNPTIIILGCPVFIEFINSINDKEKIKKSVLLARHLINYSPFLGVLLFNYYQTGFIVLQMAHSSFLHNNEGILSRFFAYFLDLNFGILPYYPFLLIIFCLMLICSIKIKEKRFVLISFAFIGNVILYSFMTHINCGMVGMARYNVWGTISFLFATILFKDIFFRTGILKKILPILIILNVGILAIILDTFGIYSANKTWYTSFTPIAEFILDRYPVIYNPLHSTFNSRVNHIDGGYDYTTPIIYVARDGYVRKILASNKDKDNLLKMLKTVEGSNHLEHKLGKLRKENTYISFTKSEKILYNPSLYKLGNMISFKNLDNYKEYLVNGLSNAEEWGTWSVGKECNFNFFIEDIKKDYVWCTINSHIYKGPKPIYIYVNDNLMYSNNSYSSGEIKFKITGNEPLIHIKIKTPESVSPSKFGSKDQRILGLALESMVIE